MYAALFILDAYSTVSPFIFSLNFTTFISSNFRMLLIALKDYVIY